MQIKTETKILVFSTGSLVKKEFKAKSRQFGYKLEIITDSRNTRNLIENGNFRAIILEIDQNSLSNAAGLIKLINRLTSECSVIVILEERDLYPHLENRNLTISEILLKPVKHTEILRSVRSSIEIQAVKSLYEQLKNQHSALLDGVHDGVIFVNRDLRITRFNPAFISTIGASPEAMIGSSLNEILPGQFSTIVDAVKSTITTGSRTRAKKTEIIGMDSRRKVVLFDTNPLIDRKYNISEAVIILKDITRETRLEEKIEFRNRFRDIIGGSPRMQEIYSLLEDLSGTDSTVLITGETGTGKEMVASIIHDESRRSHRQMISLDCTDYSELLLETELFGNAEADAAFSTGETIGKLEIANGGTILLKEIGELAHGTQIKLLRFLHEKEYNRRGETVPLRSDVRLIATSRYDLKKLMEDGRFSSELYYMLNIIRIDLPPLRNRGDDLVNLVDHFRMKLNQRLERHVQSISDDVLEALKRYYWPGNVRELVNSLERAFIVCHDRVLQLRHLPLEILEAPSSPRMTRSQVPEEYYSGSNRDTRSEKAAINDLLQKTDWNIAKTARLLGIARNTLYRKIEYYGIRKS